MINEIHAMRSPGWNNRRKELEYNLMLVAQSGGIANDSYEDVRAIMGRILEDATFLSDGDFVGLQVNKNVGLVTGVIWI